ncbi:MAG: thymidine phosphorylase [Xanthomonadales bacterium]|nr:thymidine phosphorylase [Xanthomonadales bacterium]
MLFTDVIRKKRDGHALTEEEIGIFVAGLADRSLPAEQVSALAMAIYLNGMSVEEAGALTLDMASSGVHLDWESQQLGGPVVDKHSTGGVGDKVSFMLAPIAVACGCYVPMISGRGLGHTGGTLDKADSIPGYASTPDLQTFQKVVKTVGCAIIGQTVDLAPADQRFYAIRDVTGTVESIPLITASILSKKIAAGNRGLVMDVKVGSGAFMEKIADARALAKSIIGTAAAADLATHALISDMNEVLGETAGNALEIAETVLYLTNVRREERLDRLVLDLAAEMQIVTGLMTDRQAARHKAREALASGKAAEIFARMVSSLGGPVDFLERHSHYLPVAPVVKPVHAEQSGYVSAVNGRAIGNAIIELGGGRRAIDDKLDLSVGFAAVAPIGAEVGPDRPLTIVHAANEGDAEQAAANIHSAVTVAADKPATRPVVYEILTST